MEELAENGRATGFVKDSLEPDPECKTCPYGMLCRGGCRRNRETGADGSLGKNCFCGAYKRFFEAALPRLRQIAARLSMEQRR